MAEIALVDLDYEFTTKGGGTAVNLHIIEALQDQHDVTVFTFREPDVTELNEFFNTRVDERVTFRTAELASLLVHPTIRTMSRLTGYPIGATYAFRVAVMNRLVRAADTRYDLYLSMINEMDFDGPSIQYIHDPINYSRIDAQDVRPVIKGFKFLCRGVAGFDTDRFERDATLVANSRWNASQLAEMYDIEPLVVYPPIDVDEFSTETNWDERERTIVSVGRISSEKNVLRNIEITAALRERGHSIRFKHVGPQHDGRYGRRVSERANRYDFVEITGEVARGELVDVVSRHRYGLHGREDEPFGMVVAEMIAGGMIPFVHDSGGPPEIVNERDELTYASVEEAVDKMDRVLSDSTLQTELQAELAGSGRRFGKERFADDIRTIVAERLAESDFG